MRSEPGQQPGNRDVEDAADSQRSRDWLPTMRVRVLGLGVLYFSLMILLASTTTPSLLALINGSEELGGVENTSLNEPQAPPGKALAEDDRSPEDIVIRNDTTSRDLPTQSDNVSQNPATDNQSESPTGIGTSLKPVYLAWNRTFPEVRSRSGDWRSGATKIIRSPDGGFLVLGVTQYYSSSEGTCIHLLRIDGSGRTLWESENVGAGTDVAYCEDGSYLVVGTKRNLSNKGPIPDNLLSMFRIDDYGYKVWEKVPTIEGNVGHVWMTQDRGVLVATGSTVLLTGERPPPFLLVRFDQWGDRLYDASIEYWGYLDVLESRDGGFFAVWWDPLNTTDEQKFLMFAGRFDRELNRVWTTPLGVTDLGSAKMFGCSDGGVLVLAYDVEPHPDALTVLKIDSRGEVLRNMSYASATPGLIQWPGPCTRLKDGGFLLAGSAQLPAQTAYVDPPPPYCVFVLRFGPTGDTIMEQFFETGNVTRLDCAIETDDGGFLLGGHWETYWRRTLLTGSYIIKLDSWGNRIWEYGTPWLPSCTIQCGEGEYIMAGSTKILRQWNRDGFVLKLTEKQGFIPEPAVTRLIVDIVLLVMLMARRKPKIERKVIRT